MPVPKELLDEKVTFVIKINIYKNEELIDGMRKNTACKADIRTEE
jgi:hypothetical protein